MALLPGFCPLGGALSRALYSGILLERQRRRRSGSSAQAACVIFSITFLFSADGRADPIVEFSGATGFGMFAAGVTQGRFAISPNASFSVHGERGFFMARNTVSFLGATGGRFGINNETSVGGGLSWERVNVSAGFALAAFSLPICGPHLCSQMRGLVPGGNVRLDVFGAYLSGSLGASVDCGFMWVTGNADAVWSGASVRCSAGPIFRFTSRLQSK